MTEEDKLAARVRSLRAAGALELPSSESGWRRLTVAFGKVGEHLATVVLLAGGLATAALYFAASRFYSELGVAPGDVGIQVQDVIPQSLVGLVYTGLLVIGAAGPVALLGAFAIDRYRTT